MFETVTGLDLSLTAAGIAVASRKRGSFVTEVSVSKSPAPVVPKGERPSLEQRLERQSAQVGAVLRRVPKGGLVIIEAPSYGSKFGSPHERSGLWWRIVRQLSAHGALVVEVSPKTRAKYATGSGKESDKRKVLAAVRESFPAVVVPDHNAADALACAAMGWRWLGLPMEVEITGQQLEAMRGVRWPELTKGMTV